MYRCHGVGNGPDTGWGVRSTGGCKREQRQEQEVTEEAVYASHIRCGTVSMTGLRRHDAGGRRR